ncbi:MAG: PorT family protein [Ignavibacteria bacterium]|nr:PorT family protein [Ignavibacteria bacterium]
MIIRTASPSVRIAFSVTALCIFLLGLTPLNASSQVKVSAFGGLNLATLSGDSPENTAYSGGAGYIAGLKIDYPLTKDIYLSLQPNYSVYGATLGFDVNEEDYRDSISIDFSYFRVPLVVTFEAMNGITYFSSGFDLGIFNEAGSEFVNGSGSRNDISDYFESLDLSVLFGAGANLPVGPLKIGAELRYVQSLTNASSGKALNEGGYLPPRFRMSGLQILGGVTYKF